MPTRHRPSISVIILLLTCAIAAGRTPAASAAGHVPPAARATAARIAPPAPRAAPASDLDCSASPFGSTLTLGAEREPLVSFRSPGGLAQWDQLDATSPTALGRQLAFPSGTPNSALQGVSAVSAVALDTDSNGETELAQLFTDSAGALRTATYFRDGSSVIRSAFVINNTQIVAHATTSNGKSNDRLIFASRSSTGSLNLMRVDPVGEVVLGTWRTNQNGRGNPQMLDMAVGDFDGDGFHDDVAIAYLRETGGGVEIVIVTPGNVPATGSGANFILNMREIGSTLLNIGTPARLRIAAGDIDGDRRDEIIYAQENFSQDSPGVSSGIAIRTFDPIYAQDRLSATLQQSAARDFSAATGDLALATGDTDRDGLAEIVMAYHQFTPDNGLMVRSFDLGIPAPPSIASFELSDRATFFSNTDQRTQVNSLALDTGDMDKDGLEDIVLAFRDAGGALQTVRLSDQRGPTGALTLKSSLRDTAGGRTNASAISLVMGDWNNDSLKAKYAPIATTTLQCKTVVEPNVTSAVFVPPFWQNIQGSAQRYGSIGESKSKSFETSSGITTSRSHSVSAYFGFEVDAEVAEFSARVTAGYEYAASQTVSGSTNTGQTISEGWTNNTDSFAVIENATYNCYNYETKIDNAVVDGNVRFCEYQSTSQEGPTIDTWDVQYGPANNPESKQWAPIARDWTSLTQFRAASAVQSDGGTSASRAADGNTDGALANSSITAQGNSPWWQIDLGSSQPVSTIRVWNRTDRDCGGVLCPTRLTNFHVFVSDVDPRTISDDPNVLKTDARIHDYVNTGVGAKVTSFQTLNGTFEPISGRFVRVQLTNPGILSLAEVQVFAGNHVEPDSYPVSVSDPDSRIDTSTGAFVPGTDGWFLVKRYNPLTKTLQDVRTRGNLRWNGAAQGVLQNKVVGPGAGQPTWSLSQDRGTSRTEAQEISHSVRVGAEFDVAAGVVTKATAGGSYEFSTGVATENSRTVSYGTAFELGGGIEGFPTTLNGKPAIWPLQCKYGFQPYSYDLTETSNSGYEHRMLVVDYVVPALPLERSANLDPCRAGPTPPTQQSLESNFESGAPGSVFVLTAQNFPPNTSATISLKQPGVSAFRTITRVTTDANGSFVFVFATRDGDPVGTYTIRFAVDGTGASTAATVLEVPLTLAASEPARADKPADLPVVTTDAATLQRLLFIPLVGR